MPTTSDCMKGFFFLNKYHNIHFLSLSVASKEQQWSWLPGTSPQSHAEEFFILLLFIIIFILTQLLIGEEDKTEETSSDGATSAGQAGKGK